MPNSYFEYLNIPLTIEQQLENYCKSEGHTDRHETLWHAWHQNKRWISQVLEVTLSSFPTYSKHDESHALSVLNNIEMILGQARIAQLSASDCFVLLHTVYIHDIGMCITQRDRKDIIENATFIEMIDQLENSGSESVKRAIKILKRTEYETFDPVKGDSVEQLRQLYRAKLDVYYAIIELISAYRRSEHGRKSAERLNNWVMESDKFATGFSMAGIPLRIFLTIAKSAQMHTSNDFEEIKKLPRKDGGYASDYYHPRFISILLMLGDLLDMDNDRFHPMVFEFVEQFPEQSKYHYEKHRAIRKLNINPDSIEIEADCKDQNTLRLVRKECDMLLSILKGAGYMWSAICPEGFQGSLPALNEVNLYLDGMKIPEDLVATQFHISQNKAFSILEGSNFYDERYVFLREFLQNAIDASKMQYWYDYLGTATHYYEEENVKNMTPEEMNKHLALERFPVEIHMKMQKRDEMGELSDVSTEEIGQIRKGVAGQYEYGVLVIIKDFGTGIDRDSIIAISKVGNSRKKDKCIIEKMPEWLQPTAEFGVGLQSAFLLTESFKCRTRTRSGEQYEINFHSGSSSQYEGYINVIPFGYFEQKYETYGTSFEVFVPIERKFLHSESICTWSGSDPFSEDYDNTRIIRHASELISQMTLYLDNLLGESLFPIMLDIEKRDELHLMLNTKDENTIHKLINRNNKQNPRRNIWIFQRSEKSLSFGDTEKFVYAFEYDTSRLFLWAKELNVFCAVSGANLIRREHEGVGKKRNSDKSGIPIYYKGIKMQARFAEEDAEIFEYIDVKASFRRSFINISRRGFTREGKHYFEKVIYRGLLDIVQEILQQVNENEEIMKMLSKNIIQKIEQSHENVEIIEDLITEEKNYCDKTKGLADQILSLSFLSHLAVKDIKDELSLLGKKCKRQNSCLWKQIIYNINDALKHKKNQNTKEMLKQYSVLFNIQGYAVYDYCEPLCLTIVDIFAKPNCYGILQVRADSLDEWITYIVSVPERIYSIFEKRMANSFTQLEAQRDMDQMLENWAVTFFNASKSIGNAVSDDKKFQQQFLLTWLLKNMPTIAVFGSHDGNRRLNILSDYIFPYIYTNIYHKELIISKIMEIAAKDGYKRFSTYAWQDRHYLEVTKLPFSCYFCKRGFLNNSSLYKVIVPLEGDTLQKMHMILNQTEEQEFVKYARDLTQKLDFKQYYIRLFEDGPRSEREEEIFKKYNELGKNPLSLNDLNELFIDVITPKDERTAQKELAEEGILSLLTCQASEWEKVYLELLNIYLVKEEHVKNNKIDLLREESICREIYKGWYYIKIKLWEELPNYLKMPKLKQEYLQNHTHIAHKKVVGYIQDHKRYPLKTREIEDCITMFIEEIFMLAEELEKEKMRDAIEI